MEEWQPAIIAEPQNRTHNWEYIPIGNQPAPCSAYEDGRLTGMKINIKPRPDNGSYYHCGGRLFMTEDVSKFPAEFQNGSAIVFCEHQILTD